MLIKTDDQRTDLGYFLLDHRQAGVLPPGVCNPLVEQATFTCSHCQFVVVMNPNRIRPRTKCGGCSHLICDGCAAKKAAGAPCKTWAQVVDEALAQAERQADGPSLILPTS
jgi:hypothetical protein